MNGKLNKVEITNGKFEQNFKNPGYMLQKVFTHWARNRKFSDFEEASQILFKLLSK